MSKIRYIIGVVLLCVACVVNARSFTLVIDAGHGGQDTGAVGPSKVREKDLTLKYALAFGKMVERNCPYVKVIYTRKTDRFVELYRRAEIANKNKADLFISIHINALPKGKVARGFQTYTLGTSKRTGKNTGVLENLEVAKRENEVIFMEKDYKQTYQDFDPNSLESTIMFEFVQDKNMENSVELAKYMQKYVCQATGRQDMGAQQDNLAVLRLSSMPGCLVECGFISTRDEESFMNSKDAPDRYARGLYNAFVEYYKHHDSNATIAYQPEPKTEVVPEVKPEPVHEVKPEPVKPDTKLEEKAETKPQEQPQQPQETAAPVVSDPVFKVQIFVSSSQLKAGDARFKGLTDVTSYKEGGMYKYTVGSSPDYNEISRLRKEVAGRFPQAFVVAFKDGVRMDINQAVSEFRKNKK